MKSIILVGLGGMVGCILRYLTNLWCTQNLGLNFPYGTLVVNVIGCLFIGLVAGLLSEKNLLGESMKLLLITGFAGGFTTFSSFSYETLALAQHNLLFSFLNVSLNLICGFLATFIGLNLTKVF